MNLFRIAVVTICLSLSARAEKIEAGPRKGRLLRLEKSNVEFVLAKDRFITLAFYDAALKPQAQGSQVVTVVADSDEGEKTIQFARKGDFLVSTAPIPAGDGYNIFVHAQDTADSAPRKFRINVDLSICGGCKHAEYVCTCGE